MKRKIIFLILINLAFTNFLSSKDALIILGGVFGDRNTMNHISQYFKKKYDYDVYVINFLNKKSLEVSYNNIIEGINKVDLSKYDKVNFFCYIFGGRLLLKYFSENKIGNLGSVVFDRGPIEEALVLATREKDGDQFLRLAGGQSLVDFSYLDCFTVPENLKTAKIGIIVETKAITICYFYKKEIKELNPSFSPSGILDKFDDYCYVPLNHLQMYKKLDVISGEVDCFIKNGKFSEMANREQKNYLALF